MTRYDKFIGEFDTGKSKEICLSSIPVDSQVDVMSSGIDPMHIVINDKMGFGMIFNKT